jgi:uncharacterized protein
VKILDSSDTDLEAFDTVCRRLGGFNGRVLGEWADGYLTALAAGPRAVALDEWLPRMAGDAFERAFADPEDAAQARQALAARAQVLANHLDPEALLDNPEELRLQPLVSLWDDAAYQALVEEQGVPAEEARQMTTGGLWAEGFFDAIEDFAADWQVPDFATAEAREVFDEILLHVSVLMLPDGDELKAHLELFWKDRLATREDLLDEACFAIQDLRIWWVDHAPRPATRRVEAQPGRNDPCPCGSGLKFKKCHGKSA